MSSSGARLAAIVVLCAANGAGACHAFQSADPGPADGGARPADGGPLDGLSASTDGCDSRCAPDGAVVLATAQRNPKSIAVDGENVYWTTDDQNGGVMQRPLGGCGDNPRTLALAQPGANFVTAIFWNGAPAVAWATVTAGVVHAARPLGAADAGPVVSSIAYGSVAAMTFAAGWLFIAAQGILFRCAPDNLSLPEQCNEYGNQGSGVGGIAVDVTAQMTYWTTSEGIFSCGVNAICIENQTPIHAQVLNGLAVGGSNLYATQDSDPGNVFSISPNAGASAPGTAIAPGAHGPSAIAGDGRSVFWLTRGTGRHDGTLVRYDVGAKKSTVLLSDLDAPSAMAIDTSWVYWTNAGTGEGATGSVMKLPR